ncbi:MAG: hypothetical protein P9L94_14360 [Candidatus Hinthialibacter antarcticus]|nr:hypothetical protein [Candidatus Hinthialibacter antarcticus]
MDAVKENPLLDIARRLRLRIQLNETVTDALDEFSGKIRTNAGWFDKPDEVQNFIHKFRDYLQSYSLIIQKILKQIEDEITEDHIHSLRNISNRNDVELQRCFQFQRFAIARGANETQAEPILQKIYTTIRDRIETDKDLGALIADMLRFVQAQTEHDAPEQTVHDGPHGPRMALRSKDVEDESTGEKAYKLIITFFIATNLGRIIALSAFICIGISFAMNYTQKGPGMIDAISNSDFEKEAAELDGPKKPNLSEDSLLEMVPVSKDIISPTKEQKAPREP